MSKLRYILLILTLCPALLWAQRRFSANDQPEIDLHRQSGFSSREVENKTDALFGLHASLYSGTHHLIGLSVDGGWSSFINNMPTAKNTPGGGSVGLHFLYEYQYSGLIIQTGIGIAYQRVFTDLLDTAIYHYDMKDAWSGIKPRLFDLRHTFYDRRDMSQQVYGRIPVYVGHYIFGGQGIGYFLAGFHMQYAFWGNTKQKLTGSTTGKYHDFVGVWDEMDNHGFRKDVPITYTSARLPIKLGKAAGLDVLGHLEGGYEFNTFQKIRQYRVKRSDKLDCRLRFAGFVDVSLGSIYPHGAQSMYESDVETGRKGQETLYDFYHPFKTPFVMNHIYSTAVPGNKTWLRNMTVGVRFTVLFSLQAQEHCILCDPWRH